MESPQDPIVLLREQRPNVSNKEELLALMDVTREVRRRWINDEQPSITNILRKYPRLQDLPDAVQKARNSSAPVYHAAKLVAAFLRVVRVTACLVENNGSLLLGL